MGYQNLLIENRGPVRRIIINRPEKLNALNHVTVNELHLAFDQAAAEDDVRVVVLAGAGGKAFVAGADISELNGLSPVDALAFSDEVVISAQCANDGGDCVAIAELQQLLQLHALRRDRSCRRP